MPRWFANFVVIAMLTAFSRAVCNSSAHDTSLSGFTLSPDATMIAASAKDGSAVWWDVHSGNRHQLDVCISREVFDDPVFSPDSTRLAVRSEKTIYLFEMPTGRPLAQFSDPGAESIDDMVFSGNSQRLAATTDQGTIVWDLRTTSKLFHVPESASRHGISLDSSGGRLALSTTKGIEIWDLERGSLSALIAANQNAEFLLFTGEGSQLIALMATPLPHRRHQRIIESKRDLVMWNTSSGDKLRAFQQENELDEFSWLSLTQNGDVIATDYRSHLLIWDVNTGSLKNKWETFAGVSSRDGKLFLRETGEPGVLELWEIGSAPISTFKYRSPICAERFEDKGAETKFDGLFVADGFGSDDAPVGTFSVQGYVAMDCTPVSFTQWKYKSDAEAKAKFQGRISDASEIVEESSFGNSGRRIVVRYDKTASRAAGVAVIRVGEKYLNQITSPSLAVALAFEKHWQR